MPYVLAYVELDEGPRVMTNIVDCDVADVRIGQRVEARFDDTGCGHGACPLRARDDGGQWLTLAGAWLGHGRRPRHRRGDRAAACG